MRHVKRSPRRLFVESLEDRTVPSGLSLVDHTFFGGSGDQRGTAIAMNAGALFVSGNVQPESQSPGATALVLRYATPTANGVAPVWSRTFGFGTTFFGIAATNEGVYPVGWNYSLSNDPVGGKEVKSIAAKFAPDGSSGPGPGGSQWVRTPNIYGYSGVEAFQTATTADIGGTTYLYAGGGGQPFSFYAFTVAKYDTAGNLLNVATDPFMVNPFGGSETRGIAVLNNNVYAAGFTNWGSPAAQMYPILTKYNANLGYLQQMKDTTLTGGFNAVTTFGGALYTAGYSNTTGVPNSENFLIQKYDEVGNRLWSTNFGGAGADILTGIVGMGSSLYAVGYTASSGAGGRDVVILEIDPASGNLLSTTLFGGAQDDLGNGIVTDGTNLYVVGESRSFAQGGNTVGQNDVLLLHYVVANTNPVADAGGPYTIAEGQSLLLDASGSFDPDTGDAIVSYAWELDGDNDFNDVVTTSPTTAVTWASLVALGIDDGFNPAVPQTISVRVTDQSNATNDASTTLTLTNAAPTVTSFTAGAGQTGGMAVACNPVTFALTLTDPSPVDEANPFTYQINWGDGTPVESITGGTSITVTHSFDNTGTFTPTVVATDKDGSPGSVAFNGPAITVTAIQVIDGNLVIAGTNAADSITVNTYTTGSATVTRNGVSSSWALPTGGRIVVRGCNGNDVIAVNGPVAAEIFGGAGNDYLYGGSGSDQLWGEAGNDYLTLGAGNDVGIGGLGRDLLYGGNGNDVLVGGDVNPLTWGWTALQTVSTDWSNHTDPLTAPASAQALAAATTDPATTSEYDRFWGNTGKDLHLYRAGLGGDQINGFSVAEKDFLLALMP